MSTLQAIVARCERDLAAVATSRDEGDALADAPGAEPDAAFAWRVLVVRGAIGHAPDDVRELYGALVDRYRDDPARLATLRPLGDEIRARESRGELPSTLVARSDRKR